jgi:hypothetical protein
MKKRDLLVNWLSVPYVFPQRFLAPSFPNRDISSEPFFLRYDFTLPSCFAAAERIKLLSISR